MRARSVRLRSMCFLALSEMPMRACTFSCRLHAPPINPGSMLYVTDMWRGPQSLLKSRKRFYGSQHHIKAFCVQHARKYIIARSQTRSFLMVFLRSRQGHGGGACLWHVPVVRSEVAHDYARQARSVSCPELLSSHAF